MKTIVPVSGGKDSQVVLSLALADQCDVVAVHQNTGFDHPDTYRQIEAMEDFYGIKIEQTVNRFGGTCARSLTRQAPRRTCSRANRNADGARFNPQPCGY